MVAYHPLGTFRIPDKVEFKFLMIMEREIKRRFCTGKGGKAIALGEWCDFPDQLIFHISSS
jgi:hypothetical protein